MAYFNTACESVIVVIQLSPFSTLCYALQGIVVIMMSPGKKKNLNTEPSFVKGEITLFPRAQVLNFPTKLGMYLTEPHFATKLFHLSCRK
jgi:hypothetical protein